MMRPPPTEPGTPPRNSTPPSDASVAARRSLPVETPASTTNPVSPCRSRRRRLRVDTTRPRTPPSRTRRFEPPPTAVTATPWAAARASAADSAAIVDGAYQASAGPPMRSVVWRAIGSSKRTSPSRSLKSLRSTRRRRREEREELAAGELDVSGAEGDDDVAVLHRTGEVGGHVLAPRHVAHVLVAVVAHRLRQPRAVDARERRLARGEDVAHHHRVGVV